MDQEVNISPVALDMVYGLMNTGTRRDFVAIRYVKGNNRRSTSRRAGPGRLEMGSDSGVVGGEGRAWERDHFLDALTQSSRSRAVPFPLFLPLVSYAYIYIFSFLYAICPESTALINPTLPSSFANSSCSPRCTPLISPLPCLWSTFPFHNVRKTRW